ncbi:MAG: hypothetical protein M3347_19250, partial [Armatimonadota bacterium]|nr:hypothetical protein [Armatimonadota bacterium]
VDPIAVQEIQHIVLRLKAQGIGILITDHNVYDTLDIIDRAYILYNGQIMTHGTAREIVADERARELYFGEKITRHHSHPSHPGYGHPPANGGPGSGG